MSGMFELLVIFGTASLSSAPTGFVVDNIPWETCERLKDRITTSMDLNGRKILLIECVPRYKDQ